MPPAGSDPQQQLLQQQSVPSYYASASGMTLLSRHSLDGLEFGAAAPAAAPQSPLSSALAFGAPAAPGGGGGAAPGGGDPSSQPPSQQPRGPTGWQAVVGLAALGIVICYADRSNMSTAIIPMATEFGWDKAYQGVVLSAFFLGYAATQILGGTLADRYGGKAVLAAGVALWSLFTGLTPQAAGGGAASLLAARVLLGVGEGVAFPAVHSIIARNVPTDRQSTAVGVVTAASYVGTALAFGLSPSLISKMGWQAVFYLFGAMALLWLPLWFPIKEAPRRGMPRTASGGVDEESVHLLASSDDVSLAASRARQRAPQQQQGQPPGAAGAGAGAAGPSSQQQPGSPAAAGPLAKAASGGGGLAAGGGGGGVSTVEVLKSLVTQREVAAICLTQYCQSYGMYGLLTWLPTFFSDYYGVEVGNLGGFTLLPYVVQGAVGAASGALADRLISGGWGVRKTRVLLQVVGMVGPAACLLAAVAPTGAGAAAASALITVGLGLSALTLGGVSASHLDVAPRHAGMVFGAGNTAATLAGLVAVPLTGLLLDRTGSWVTVFSVVGVHYLAGAAVWAAWAGDKQLPQDLVDDAPPAAAAR